MQLTNLIEVMSRLGTDGTLAWILKTFVRSERSRNQKMGEEM
jgi:hypothetical protein